MFKYLVLSVATVSAIINPKSLVQQLMQDYSPARVFEPIDKIGLPALS